MKNNLIKLLMITCMLSIYGYSSPEVLNTNLSTDATSTTIPTDDEINLLEGEVRQKLETINALKQQMNGIYSYNSIDNINQKINEYNSKREELVKMLNQLPEDHKRKNDINMFPEFKSMPLDLVNDSNDNGIIDREEILEYEKIIEEIKEKKAELDKKIDNKKIINPNDKKQIQKEIDELNEKIRQAKIDVEKLQSVDFQYKYIKIIISAIDEYNKDVIVNDIDGNGKKDSEELNEANKKINELDEREKDIQNIEKSLPPIINPEDKQKIDNKKTEYNNLFEKYKNEIKDLNDSINGVPEIKDKINNKKELDLATVIVNDIDSNGKKDSDEIKEVENVLKILQDKTDIINSSININRILTRDEKRDVNNKIDEYNHEKENASNLINSLNDKISEKQELLKKLENFKEFVSYDLNKVESEVVRKKLNEKLKDLEELLAYIEANKEKINNKIDEVNNKKIEEYDELDNYLNNLDIFVKDEYVDILNKVKENIDLIKKTIEYLKISESTKKELEEKLSKEHLNFTKEELKTYYTELKSFFGNLDGKLLESVKYVYPLQYEDTSIKNRFDENYYFKFSLGSSLPNLLNQLINKDKVYAKHIVNNFQLGFNKKVDNFNLGAFIEYANNVAHQVSFGVNVKGRYITSFARYRLAILEKDILANKDNIFNNNLDIYLSSNYLFKINNLAITPRIGLYLATSFETKLENDIYLKTRTYGNIEFGNNLEYNINGYRLFNDISIKGGINNPVLVKKDNTLEVDDKLYVSYNVLFGFDKQIYDGVKLGTSFEINGIYDKLYTIPNHNVNLKLGMNLSYSIK